jgi:DNA-binding response OmpR family regulator
MDHPHILVVDDNVEVRDALALALSFANFYVKIAVERLCALKMLRDSHCCDAILMDWNMPGMPAREFIEQARSTHPQVPIILVTAISSAEEIARSLGLKHWLMKPIEFEKMVKLVQNCIDEANVQHQQ